MTNLDLQARDQVLAMAMDPKANTLVFTDEDFDAELTLDDAKALAAGWGWFRRQWNSWGRRLVGDYLRYKTGGRWERFR